MVIESPINIPDGVFERLKIERTFEMILHARELEENSLAERTLCTLPGYSAKRVSDLRTKGLLLAFQIAYREGLYYPLWQFDNNWQPVSFLGRFTALGEELGYTPRTLNYFMTQEYFDAGKTPLQIVLEGDEERALQFMRDAHSM